MKWSCLLSSVLCYNRGLHANNQLYVDNQRTIKMSTSASSLADVPVNRSQVPLATNWSAIKPIEYDYSVYNATTREEREVAEKAISERRAAEQKEEDQDGEFTADVPLWASNAVKYEWRDEYGDIGPAQPELEKQLFRDRFTNRAGSKLET